VGIHRQGGNSDIGDGRSDHGNSAVRLDLLLLYVFDHKLDGRDHEPAATDPAVTQLDLKKAIIEDSTPAH